MYQGLASDVIILDNCLLPLNESELVKSLTNYEAPTHLQVAVSLSDTPGPRTRQNTNGHDEDTAGTHRVEFANFKTFPG